MRVVVTSAYPEEVAGAYLESTIERFIRKPYRFADLVRLIYQTSASFADM